MRFLDGFADELTKLADTQGKKGFVHSPEADMLADHVLGGPAVLGALRGEKGGGLKNAVKGELGAAAGNAVGGVAGFGAGKLVQHVLKTHGIRSPGWLVPGATAVGGLAVAPAFIRHFTHR